MKEIKLSEYARLKNRSYRTMWNHFKEGKLPQAYQSETGAIYIKLDNNKEKYVVTYARVSSNDQKKDLISQEKRIIEFANSNGYVINKSYKEIASGLNDNRPKLQKILKDEKITTIIVENRDRLTRFGFNYLKTLLEKDGIEIVVMNDQKSEKEELIEDFISVITSFCARIYGQRRVHNKKKEIVKILK